MAPSLPQAGGLRGALLRRVVLAEALSLCSAHQGGTASPIAGVLLPGLLRRVGGEAEPGPQAWEDSGVLRCIDREAGEEEVMANLTRVVDLVREPPGDPLLILRSALRRLGATLTHLGAVLASCLPPQAQGSGEGATGAAAAFSAVVAQLCAFIEDGKLNDGVCPFTGKRQTTIGGEDVRRELGALVKHGWDEGDRRGMAKASKALGKLLWKVRRADGKDPPGSPPVNWELRAAMFGRGSTEL